MGRALSFGMSQSWSWIIIPWAVEECYPDLPKLAGASSDFQQLVRPVRLSSNWNWLCTSWISAQACSSLTSRLWQLKLVMPAL